MSARRTSLTRTMGVGESMTFDGGRIVMTVEKRYGQKARIRFELAADVVIEKPGGIPVRVDAIPTLTEAV